MLPVLFLACAAKVSDSANATMSDEDAQIAAEIWNDIQGFEDNWTEPDLWQGIQPSIDGTHGAYVQIWADAAALEAINNGTEVPDGGTIVKCGFENESGSPVGESGHALTAMRKIDGYDPDNQNWFWVRFDGQTGEVDRFAGAVPMCSGCHAADPNGDYIRITE